MRTSGSSTALAASRMRTLRQAAEMSGTNLAEKMQALGIMWNRTTVAKVETGHRASISVDELQALAHVFRVSPLAFMNDAACTHCLDWPPRGFTCNTCKKTS